MYGILATGMANWPVIRQIAWLLGKLMDGIYNVLDSVFGIQNIGICIIMFTIITYTLMIPLTIKQQKWSKMQTVMNPEIQKITKKYQNKKDQASIMKQQDELKAVYDKYGASPSGGCLPMLIQMPVLFALYPVIQNIPNYVSRVKDIYMPIVEKIMSIDGFQKVMETIGEASPVLINPSNYDYSKADTLVNVLYKFQDSTWDKLVSQLPSLEGIVNTTMPKINNFNTFLGINIGETPWTMLMTSIAAFSIVGIIIAVIIPLLSGAFQYLSVRLQPQAATDSDNEMVKSMQKMTYTMPLFSVFLGFTLPAGMGIYWAVSALVRCVQQVVINKYMSKKSVDDLIEENRKKMAKKREKNGVPAQEIKKMATTNTRTVDSKVRKSSMTEAEREKKLEQAAQKKATAKKGSLSDKANMVSRYSSNNKK